MSNATGSAAKVVAKCHDARDPSPPTPFSLSSFLDSTRVNLQFERDAEVEEERTLLEGGASAKALEAAGLMLRGLRITEVKTGLYGRCLVTLQSSRGGGSDGDGGRPLRHSEITARDIVELRDARTGGGGGGSGSSSARITTGVVYRVRESSITLALDEFLDASIQQSVPFFNVVKLGDQVTYERYSSALSSLSELTSSASSSLSSSSRLLRVLYGDERAARSTRSLPWTPFSPDLNESQKQAIQGALDANDVYMIHGVSDAKQPPGTGKTTTVVELIRQLVAGGQRVLACAPSNLAVDNLVEKLNIDASSNQPLPSSASSSSSLKSNSTSSVRLVRLGHPARVTSAVLDHTLDNIVRTGEGSEVRRGIREDMDTILKAIVKAERNNERTQRNQLRREMRELQQELRRVERMAVKKNLKSMQVVCATLTNCASKTILEHFGGHHKRNDQRDSSATSQGFDVIVIDEAAQAMEVACLLAILRANPSASKVILAGDPRQLGPTIKSSDASNGGLGRTLFERLMQREDGKENSCMLVEQYRMNEIIMKWSSNEMYGGRLIGAPSVTSRLLCDLPGVRANEDTSNPFMLIDTAGCDMDEDEQQDGAGGSASGKVGTLAVQMQRSKSNRHESHIIQSHLNSLLDAGVQPKQIGIITPYSGQVSLLRELLLDGPSATRYHGLEIGTVDGFQGREKEAILLSLVRSNPDREIGFLSDHRRMNVAVTRARRHVTLILDSQTISVDPFLERMAEYGMEHGLYRSAEEFTTTTRVEGGSVHDLSMTAVSNNALTSVSSDALPEALRAVMGQPKQLSRAEKAQRKKERAHVSSVTTSVPSSSSVATAASASSATAAPASPAPPIASQPDAASHSTSDDEWDESRIEDICRDILREGRSRSLPSASPSTSVSNHDHSSISFSFPSTLNSFQRRLVHEVAERIGDGKELEHISEGSGMQRSIRVHYKHKTVVSTPTAATDNASTSTAPPLSSSSSSAISLSHNQRKKAAKKAATLATKQKTLLGTTSSSPTTATAEDRAIARQHALNAMEMKAKGHISNTPSISVLANAEQETNASVSDGEEVEGEMDVSTTVQLPAPSPSDQHQQKNKNKKKNNKKKSKPSNGKNDNKGGEQDEEQEEDDLDSILSEFSTSTCRFDGCRTRTTVMGFTCNYCKERYCTVHMNAALHGCGDRHREAQRNQMRQAMASSSSRPLRESDKVALKSKLEKKLNEEKKARTKQSQPSSKRK